MIAVLAGVVFAIGAIAGAPGIAYAITGVLVGAAYTIATALTRTPGPGRKRHRDRNRNRNPRAG